MSLKRLAIRTKQSISGLYSSRNDQENLKPRDDEKPPKPAESNSTRLEEFGLIPATTLATGRDSPSRRKKLFGSLQTMSSLRSLRTNNASVKPRNEAPVQTPVKTDRPELALNFEVSPPDRPMFEPTRNASASSLDVHHSSPINIGVRHSSMQIGMRTPPPSFLMGTIPDSPAPLQKPSVQDSILNHSIAPALKPRAMTTTSPPPEILVSSPSVEMMGRGMSVRVMSVVQDTGSMKRAEGVTTSNSPDGLGRADGSLETSSNDPDAPAVADPEADKNDQQSILTSVNADSTELVEAPRKHVKSRRIGTDASPCQYSEDATPQLAADDFGYLILDSPERSPERGQHRHERRTSTWGRHSGLYDGTGYGSETTSAAPRASSSGPANEEIVPEGASPSKSKKRAPAVRSAHISDANPQETLQEIIRAYANLGEATEGDTASSDGGYMEEDEAAMIKADAATSIRVMSESLGG